MKDFNAALRVVDNNAVLLESPTGNYQQTFNKEDACVMVRAGWKEIPIKRIRRAW